MRHIKLYKVFESISKSLDNISGFHKGSIKGYDVYIDDIDSEFKCTTGLRNMFPVPCHVYIENGNGVVFYKGGILFSDEKTQNEWKNKFSKLEDDPRFIKAKKELS